MRVPTATVIPELIPNLNLISAPIRSQVGRKRRLYAANLQQNRQEGAVPRRHQKRERTSICRNVNECSFDMRTLWQKMITHLLVLDIN